MTVIKFIATRGANAGSTLKFSLRLEKLKSPIGPSLMIGDHDGAIKFLFYIYHALIKINRKRTSLWRGVWPFEEAWWHLHGWAKRKVLGFLARWMCWFTICECAGRLRAILEYGCCDTVVWLRYCRQVGLVGPVHWCASGNVCNTSPF